MSDKCVNGVLTRIVYFVSSLLPAQRPPDQGIVTVPRRQSRLNALDPWHHIRSPKRAWRGPTIGATKVALQPAHSHPFERRSCQIDFRVS